LDTKKTCFVMRLDYVFKIYHISLVSYNWEGLCYHLKRICIFTLTSCNFACQLQIWNLQWQYVWFTITIWMRWFLIQSNYQNCVWGWRCLSRAYLILPSINNVPILEIRSWCKWDLNYFPHLLLLVEITMINHDLPNHHPLILEGHELTLWFGEQIIMFDSKFDYEREPWRYVLD